MDLGTIFREVLYLSFMGSIVAIIILIIKALFKNKFSATWHHYIWFLLILRLTVPFTPESSFSIFNLLPSTSQEIALIQQSENTSNVHTTPKANDVTINMETDKVSPLIEVNPLKSDYIVPQQNSFSFEVMSVVWLIGTMAMLFYIFVINLKFHYKISKLPHCTEQKTHRLFKDCKSTMNIHSNVSIIWDNSIKTPSLVGLFRPKLLMPPIIINDLSEDEKRYIFLHELSHLKRKDILINWVMMIVLSLHWFNPVVWYAFYKMKEDCEIACDADVLKQLKPEERRKYGETIINLLNIISKPSWNPAISGMVNYKSSLKRRVGMVSMFKKNSWKWSVIAVTVFILIGYIGLTSAQKVSDATAQAIKEETEGKIIQQDEKVDLGDFLFKVSKTEYYPADKDTSVIFELSFVVTNKAGEDISFIPTGEFYFVGETGKKYSSNNASMHPDSLKDYHKRIEKYYEENTLDEKVPLGVYKIGINALIDQNDKITHIIYKNEGIEKILSLQEIKPIMKTITNEGMLTQKPVENQGEGEKAYYPTYIPEGLQAPNAESSKVFREQPPSETGIVTVFDDGEYDPGPDGKAVWYQVASPNDDSIFEGRGWWLPEKQWEQIIIQDTPVKIATQFEEFEFEEKQYNHAWTWIELEKDDDVVIRVLGRNVNPDEVIEMVKSIQ